MPLSVRLVVLLVFGILLVAGVSIVTAEAPANEHFQRTWARTDQPVLNGTIPRTWVWGPEANTGALEEDYVEAAGGERQVQYFDKSRMEINNPDGDPASPFYVTNGLLVIELMTGRMQLGHDTFEQYAPSTSNVAGDQGDPDSPTYADLAALRSAPAVPDGSVITSKLNADGTVSADPSMAGQNVTAAFRVTVPGIDHQVASPFWTFLNSTGPVIVNGAQVDERLFDPWFYATGYPVTEAYWADVKVGGTTRLVLMQCFERRCLTYTPGNPDGFLTEAGNVGQHYYSWRYEQVPGEATSTTTSTVSPTATTTATSTSTPTATVTPDPPTDYSYVTSWGVNYFEQLDLGNPRDIALDEDGNIWITDHDNHRLVRFYDDGFWDGSVGTEGTAEEQFRNPSGIARYGERLYVTDALNNRVQVFDSGGGFQLAWGSPGSGNGQFQMPLAIAVHDDTVYVSDSHNHRIQRFTLAGVYLGQFGSQGSGDGQFNVPLGLMFDDEGNLYVADSGNHRIQVFTGGGTYIRQFGANDDGPGSLLFPYDLAIDSSGTFYVVSYGAGIIKKFDAQGAYIENWDHEGRFGLNYPPSILIEDDYVYITDRVEGGRIQKFTLDGALMFEIIDNRRGRFSMPNGLAIDQNGDVLFVDTYIDKPTVGRTSTSGKALDDLPLIYLGTSNNGDPLAIASGPDQYSYVAVGGVDRVLQLSTTFGYHGSFGGTGSGPGQFIMPTGLATDSGGNVYVADSGNKRIQKLDAEGNYITHWGSEGSGPSQFNKLQDIAIHGDRLYAADFGNNRVQVFDLSGTYIGEFGEPGDGPGQMTFPSGVEVNAHGYILVVEHGNNRVQLFDPEWNPVTIFGEAGSGPGEVSGPLAIAIDEDGYVYISDIGNHSVFKFAPAP